MPGGDTPVHESQVAVQCKQLEENLENAWEALGTLETRLESVLTPDTKVGNEPEKEPEIVLTPHAEFLRQRVSRTRHLNVRLRSLHGRIEL